MKVLPYVYKLIHKDSGQFYIGARWANKVPAHEDLGVYYFTSSKIVKDNFSSYIIEFIKEFETKSEAYLFEQSQIRENWSDTHLLNQRITLKENGGSLWVTQKRREWTPEDRQRLSNRNKERGIFPPSQKGQPQSPEHKMRISASNQGKSKNVGKSNNRYGKGNEILGSKNPNSATWLVKNNMTGEEVVTDDLIQFAKNANERSMYKYKDSIGKKYTITKLFRNNTK